MTKQIGFGIVGGGMIGKVQAQAISAIAGASVVAVYGRNEARAKELASQYDATSHTDYANRR